MFRINVTKQVYDEAYAAAYEQFYATEYETAFAAEYEKAQTESYAAPYYAKDNNLDGGKRDDSSPTFEP